MKNIINVSLVTVLATALALTSACAKNDYALTQAQGCLTGGLIGAGVGVAVADAIGGREGKLAGSVLFFISTAGGCAYGTSVAKKKEKYKSEEEWLKACLAEVQTANQKATAFNGRLQNTLTTLQRGGKPDKSAENTLKEGENVLADLDVIIKSQDEAVASAANTATVTQIRKEIKELKQVKERVSKGTQELASLSNKASF